MSVVQGQELTFRINKYKETALLNDKDSLVQIILNALLMVPGNLPSQPLKGVDIFQYMYHRMDSDALSDTVLTDLKNTVGDSVGMAINNLTVDTLETEEGTLFLLVLHVQVGNEDVNIALAVQKVNEVVKFNYSFLTDAVKNMK